MAIFDELIVKISGDIKDFNNKMNAGESDEREFEDGIIRKYSYEVCNIPANCRAFTIGDRVKISLLGGIEREFEVKGFHRYQLQCKIWV